jgi:hypothetical protein
MTKTADLQGAAVALQMAIDIISTAKISKKHTELKPMVLEFLKGLQANVMTEVAIVKNQVK